MRREGDQIREGDIGGRNPQFIVLLGVSGSGKTTVGKLLAKDIGCEFFEGDDFHSPENKSKMSTGIPLTDADRWPWLQRLKEVIQQTLAAGKTAVLACSALHKEYRAYLWQDGVRFVYLKGDFALFQKRLRGRKGHFFDPDLLESQFEDLEEPKNALNVDAALTPDQIVEDIKAGLGLR